MFATKYLSYKFASPTLADTCQGSVEIFERNARTESLPDDTCIEAKRLEQNLETHHGIFRR